MSLLMDAMKRAEAAIQPGRKKDEEPAPLPERHTGTAETHGLPFDLLDDPNKPLKPLEPIPMPESASQLPEISLYMESVSADLAENTPPTRSVLPPLSVSAPKTMLGEIGKAAGSSHAGGRHGGGHPASRNNEDSWREDVRNAFAAKNQAGKPARPPLNPLWVILGGLGVVALGVGGYFWYQLNQIGGGALKRTAPVAASPAPLPPPVPPIASTVPPAGAPTPFPVSPGGMGVTDAATVAPPAPEAVPLPAQTAPADKTDRATPTIMPPQAAAPTRSSGGPTLPSMRGRAAEGGATLNVQTGRSAADLPLQKAYQNLQRGALDAARADYEQVRQMEPRNVDALLGLANIAQRQGRLAEAERLLRQAAELDPKEPYIQASLLALQGNGATTQGGSTLQQESRLKALIAEQPQSASAQFSLGNLYARQGRWRDAQQAYFNAFTLDGNNPDYLFNLAVSLDHLDQEKLAVRYYRQALEAARLRGAAFDKMQVEQRLGDLQSP